MDINYENIKSKKIEAFENLLKNKSISNEKLKEIIYKENIEKGKVTKEEVQHILDKLK